MDLTAVVPALVHGIAQEVGVEMNELKVILVGDETQLDLKPFQTLREQYDQVEWDYKPLDQHHNPEPYIEIRLKQDAPLLQSYNASQIQLACDVKGSERWTSGDRPVDLYQAGSYSSCLSVLRSRLACAMEGDFVSKGAVKVGAVKSFQAGNHINKKVPAMFAQSALPLESSPHPDLANQVSIFRPELCTEFNVTFGGLAGMAFNVSTLSQHRWNTNANWSQLVAQTDLLPMHDKRGVVESTLRSIRVLTMPECQ